MSWLYKSLESRWQIAMFGSRTRTERILNYFKIYITLCTVRMRSAFHAAYDRLLLEYFSSKLQLYRIDPSIRDDRVYNRKLNISPNIFFFFVATIFTVVIFVFIQRQHSVYSFNLLYRIREVTARRTWRISLAYIIHTCMFVCECEYRTGFTFSGPLSWCYRNNAPSCCPILFYQKQQDK